ncbi:unnamed protein product [Ostreobium quekettii]|uniref:Uncharacterized protein n=1 Tax=Ostreobium quekettii TaxID=121088 RepID=A0A8S1IPH1_9CHLO|nr:unnamed protein product [Ostreobium quekettii]
MKGAANRFWRSSFIALIVLVQFTNANGLVPVFYPSWCDGDATVYDGKSGILTPSQGAFHLFPCVNDEADKTWFANQTCSENVIIHTHKSRLELLFSLVHDNGSLATLTAQPTFEGIPFVEGFNGNLVMQNLNVLTVLNGTQRNGCLQGGSRQESDAIASVSVAMNRSRGTLGDRFFGQVKVTAVFGNLSRTVTIAGHRGSGRPHATTRIAPQLPPNATVYIDFSERIVPLRNVSCDADMASLPAAINISDLLNASTACKNLGQDTNQEFDARMVKVSGLKDWDVSWIEIGRTAVLTGFVDEEQRASARVTINTQSYADFSGRKNHQAVDTINQGIQDGQTVGLSFSFPTNVRRTREADVEELYPSADNAGKAVTAVVATAAVASAGVTALTAAFPRQGNRKHGGSDCALGAGLALLSMGQKFYFTSLMVPRRLPGNYRAMASNLKWTAFSSKLPWESGDDHEVSTLQPGSQMLSTNASGLTGSNRRLLQQAVNNASQETNMTTTSLRSIDVSEDPSKDDPHDEVQRTFFWVAVLLAALVVFHALPYWVLHWRKQPIPGILVAPRLELYAGDWAIPAIAAASGILMTSSSGDVVIGVFVFALIPCTYIAWLMHTLWKNFLAHPDERGGRLTKLEDEEDGGSVGTKPGDLSAPKRVATTCCSLFEEYVMDPIFGRKEDEATWVSNPDVDPHFVDRYGPMFEDYRGTMYTSDLPATNNGTSAKRLLFRSMTPQNFREGRIRLATGVLSLMKTAFIGVYVHGEEDHDSLAQVVVLLLASTSFFVFLRVTRPNLVRKDLAVALVAEFADMASFTLTLILFIPAMDTKWRRDAIGVCMAVIQGVAFLVSFFEKFGLISGIATEAWEPLKEWWARRRNRNA